MTLSIFLPYSDIHPESPYIWLFVRQCIADGYSVSQLWCDGACSVCDRIALRNGEPAFSFPECFRCKKGSIDLFDGEGIEREPFSKYLSQEDIKETYLWGIRLLEGESSHVFRGVDLEDIIKTSLNLRATALNIEDQATFKRWRRELYISVARCYIASERYVQEIKPECAMIAGKDCLTLAFKRACQAHSVPVAECAIAKENLGLQVFHPLESECFVTGEIGADALGIPPSQAISEPVKEVMSNLAVFLGIKPRQISLFAVGQ